MTRNNLFVSLHSTNIQKSLYLFNDFYLVGYILYFICDIYMQSLSRWGTDKHAITVLVGHIWYVTYLRRLNSEDFRSFMCLDTLFLTYAHKSRPQKWRKLLKLFRIFLNIFDFFDFFEVFYTKLCKNYAP